MTNSKSTKSEDQSDLQESYSHGYDSKFVDYLEGRKITSDAAFFLPNLKAGMSLLDCGCGPGSITIDLAEFLAPGVVTGIDIASNQIEIARARASEKGVSNLDLKVGNIYHLPFGDNSFDAAFAHTVLQHLREPVKALKEIQRVLKPGGVIGVREEDTDGVIFSPSNTRLYDCWKLYIRSWRYNGGDPFIARRHRGVLHEAGFTNVKASASVETYGTPEATKEFGEVMARYMSSHLQTAINQGWIDPQKVDEFAHEWRSWGRHPDAFLAILRCEAVGWKKPPKSY